jgi:hypothetical protein
MVHLLDSCPLNRIREAIERSRMLEAVRATLDRNPKQGKKWDAWRRH